MPSCLVNLSEGVSLYLEIRILNPDSLEKVVDRGILGCLKQLLMRETPRNATALPVVRR